MKWNKKPALDLDTCEVITDLLWWQVCGLSYTATGYGGKIPSTRMVRLNNRWRRIYVAQYSNAGTAWVVLNGEKQVVE